MINTIIVEDNQYMQTHFINILKADGRFNLVGAFNDAFNAEEACKDSSVDLVLMDVQTKHNHSGLAVGERIKKSGYAKVVIVTSLIDPDVLFRAKSGAADSLWYKDHGDSDIIDVIIRTMNGEKVFPDTSPVIEINEMTTAEITPRQTDILRRFVKGMTYEEIAAELKKLRRACGSRGLSGKRCPYRPHHKAGL